MPDSFAESVICKLTPLSEIGKGKLSADCVLAPICSPNADAIELGAITAPPLAALTTCNDLGGCARATPPHSAKVTAHPLRLVDGLNIPIHLTKLRDAHTSRMFPGSKTPGELRNL